MRAFRDFQPPFVIRFARNADTRSRREQEHPPGTDHSLDLLGVSAFNGARERMGFAFRDRDRDLGSGAMHDDGDIARVPDVKDCRFPGSAAGTAQQQS